MTAMQMIDATLRPSGWPDAATVLRERWIDCALPFEKAHFLTGFPRDGGKFAFAPDWAATGRQAGRDAAAAGPHGDDRRHPGRTGRSG